MKAMKCLKMPLYVALGVFLSGTLASCSDDDNGGSDEGELSKQEKALKNVVNDYVDKTVIPTYRGLADAANDLYLACKAMNDAGVGNVTEDMVLKADQLWITARRYWELSEAWLYGAAANYRIDPHIDTWPLDKIAMQQLLADPVRMAEMDEEGSFAGSKLGEGLIGFHALEYMLFELSDATPNMSTTSKPHNLNYTEQELKYLTGVAADLRNQAFLLEAAWAGQSGVSAERWSKLEELDMLPSENYGSYMKNAGQAGSIYVNYLAAVQEMVSTGMQDIIDEVGGQKIGNPTGMGGNGSDPNYIESPYALNSIVDFTDNMKSVRNAYQGYQDTEDDAYIQRVNYSLSDYVKGLNPALDQQVKDAIQNAIDKIGAMREPFAVTCGMQEYRQVHAAAIQACNDLSDVLDEVLQELEDNY